MRTTVLSRMFFVTVTISSVLIAAVPAGVTRTTAQAAGSAGSTQSVCIAHRPQSYIYYAHGCTGHDEPEMDPLSTAAGSAQDLTWTLVLPANGKMPVDSVGPTFWVGGVVSDTKSLYGQAFLELQFYPNSMLSACTPSGNYIYTHAVGVYTACSPVWAVYGNNELAAFNAMLTDSSGGGPLVMHAGDTITDHQYITAQHDGMHITVTDLTTGHAGTIVLDSAKDGPLMPAYSVQKIGNSLGWGLVHDAPNSVVWEIGHTGNFTNPPGSFCLPGQQTPLPCYSYNIPAWGSFQPLLVKGVTFGSGGSAAHWAVVSDFGGMAEVEQAKGCPTSPGPFCSYPWYALNAQYQALTYGGDYPGTSADFGRAAQFQEVMNCPSPTGPKTTYCMTTIL